MSLRRRDILSAFLAAPPLLALGTAGARAQSAPPLEPTPECVDKGSLTIAQTEGPYFKPQSPLRHAIAADAPGAQPITLAGFVLDTNCKPVPRALVELWHADAKGAYDNAGYRFRGHVFADEGGRWWFTTIVPGVYPGRTRHYHVKVQRPSGRTLTTQLYFPDEAQNRTDFLFDRRLLLKPSRAADGAFVRYDFIVT